MAKRRLTKQQRRTISSRQEDVLSQTDFLSGQKKEGQIITHFGKTLRVEDETGATWTCRPRQNLGSLVAGDRVVWVQDEGQEGGIILARAPRVSLIWRPDHYKQQKDIAANVDQFVIVVASLPEFVPYYLDQYLVTAELFQVQPAIILNKIDLLRNDSDDLGQVRETLSYYQQALGYSVQEVSAVEGDNIADLKTLFQKKCSVVMGLSGVGKSSIVNALLGEAKVKVGEVSQATLKGKHTTTAAYLHHLPSGGDLIDSPGIREFGVWQLSHEEIYQGFKEFEPVLGHCRFRNCQHEQEPGCALSPVKDKMPEFRVSSLQRMLASSHAS